MHTKILVILLDLFCRRRQGSSPCLLPVWLQSESRQQKAIQIPTSVRWPAELSKIALVVSEIGSECAGNFTGGQPVAGEDGTLKKQTTAMGAGLCTAAQPAAVGCTSGHPSQTRSWEASAVSQCPCLHPQQNTASADVSQIPV